VKHTERARKRQLAAIKTLHTAVWLGIELSMLYVVGAGLRGRTNGRVAMASTIVAGETLIFAANGFRCPLTSVADSLGAEDGSVTDIFLPEWFARNLPAIHVPLIALAVYLHTRNLRHGARAIASAVPKSQRADALVADRDGIGMARR
jgi:hypothetical protein